MRVVRVKRQVPAVPFKVERMGDSTLVEQVVDGLRSAILTGFYKPDDVLPSTSDLAEQLGVSRIVTRNAIRALSRERLIHSRPSAGSVVLAAQERRWLGHVLLVRPVDVLSHFVSEEIFAAEEKLSRAGYLVTIVVVRRKSETRFDLGPLEQDLSRNVNLAVVFGNIPQILKCLASANVPFMYIDVGTVRKPVKGCVGRCGVSMGSAVEEFVAHCVRAGVRHVSVIGKVARSSLAASRLETAGIRVSLVEVDAAFGPRRVENLERETCRELDRLFAERGRKWLPDLIYAEDDYQATGALFSLLSHGVKIPGDVRFATLSNFGRGPALPISLTCVEFNPSEAGASVAQAALGFLGGRGFSHDSASCFRYVIGDTFPEAKKGAARAAWLAVAASLAVPICLCAATLEEGFANPPASARPQTWYHVMNGNATKEGVTCDFEAIAEAGLGGVQMFDVGCAVPQGALSFGSPEWFDFIEHAHREAKRTGIEMALRDSSGWTLSGGPWITPERSMKQVACSSRPFRGPGRFDAVLPRPAKDNGFYSDIAVLAYPTPEDGAELSGWEVKVGLKRNDRALARESRTFARTQILAKESIVDLSGKTDREGRLVWDAPAGDWTILRVGCISNGRMTYPASHSGRGLEVDKLSAESEEVNFNAYVGAICDRLGISKDSVGETGFTTILLDNWETACQNWTVGLEKEFEKRAGYSIVPYLPLFAKRVVGSVDESERVLEDFRRLLADMIAENFIGKLVSLCHARGLKCSAEPYGCGNQDDLQYGQDVDIPMGEFWSQQGKMPNGFSTGKDGVKFRFCRMAASLAHVWGRRFAAAESFTSDPKADGWRLTPFDIKSLGDRVYAYGVNRIVYHRFVHQPWPGCGYLPGMTMGRWGMHVDRTQTWWRHAAEFFKYQSRCQWMLQEGEHVADALCWRGEPGVDAQRTDRQHNDAGTALERDGYAWDICATKVLLSLKTRNGKIVAPGGTEYSVLVLPDTGVMGVETVRRIGELVDAGAKVVCPARPSRTPGVANGADAELVRIVNEVWPKGVMECSGAEALKRLGVAGDVSMSCQDGAWIHRRDRTAEWYFVARDNVAADSFEVSFRQTGMQPEIWDAETGAMSAPLSWREENGRTSVRLDFPPSGSAFVVFRRNAGGRVSPHAVSAGVEVPLSATWRVSFPVGWYRGGDAVKVKEWCALKDWKDDEDPDVKYFSGTATYRCEAEGVKRSAGERILLDLGEVKNFAEIAVNGKTYPPMWRPPFRVDVTDAVVDGPLNLEVKVTNLWPNRLIGDERLCAPDCEWAANKRKRKVEYGIKEIPGWVREGKPSPTGRHTFTTWKHWSKDDELLPSGLLGPVALRIVRSFNRNQQRERKTVQ